MSDASNPDIQALMDRVRKLLAKANDPSVGEAEAAMFASKAQELLTRHNLTIMDLGKEEAERVSPIGIFTWAPKYAGNAWRKSVANAAAQLYMCKLVVTRLTLKDKKGKWTQVPAYHLVGRESSTAVAKSMIEYLFSTGVRLSKGYSTDQGQRHLFERGYGLQMTKRLYDLYMASTSKKAAETSNLPVLYTNELALVEKFAEDNMKLRDGRSTRMNLDHVHSAAGREAANTVSLNSQVGGPKGSAPSLPKGALLLGR